jgi:hypothetical protein
LAGVECRGMEDDSERLSAGRSSMKEGERNSVEESLQDRARCAGSLLLV